MGILIAVVIAFGGGYAVCKFFGPKIDLEAGTLIHKGKAYLIKTL